MRETITNKTKMPSCLLETSLNTTKKPLKKTIKKTNKKKTNKETKRSSDNRALFSLNEISYRLGDVVTGGYGKMGLGSIPSGSGLNNLPHVTAVMPIDNGRRSQMGLPVLALSNVARYNNVRTDDDVLFVSPSANGEGWCRSFETDPSRLGLCVANIGKGLGWRIVGFFTASPVWLTHGEVSRMMLRVVFESEGSMERLESVASVWWSLNLIDVKSPVEKADMFPEYALSLGDEGGGDTEGLARSMSYIGEDAVNYGQLRDVNYRVTGKTEKERGATEKRIQAQHFEDRFDVPPKAPRRPPIVTTF